ncbi:MAG: hypothetical protein COV45_04665 [Deltaproteobacteria bacterium CG11_big_fil_rev_8_21_14_0_20_47_16]|nr:MAG: hypothetical protein COV45_04665 [Deltaproteobacteria bacterium CG11_big_fil_rev_8_21_14_0_20_47_16]
MFKEFLKHRYGLTLFGYLTAAAITGVACVLFMLGFDAVIYERLDFWHIGYWAWLTTPILFIISVTMIRWLAPCAAGAGIPQAVFAAEHATVHNQHKLAPLTSFKTLVVKILALYIAIWAGASTGREGPTVHVAACVFVGILLLFRRFLGLNFDMKSAVVAGGAAGLAAAFNTPLAGVTFAIEELMPEYFGSIKDVVLMSIIIAAIAAKTFTGDYTYFGKLADPPAIRLDAILAVSVFSGLAGILFAAALLNGRRVLSLFYSRRSQIILIVILSFALLGLATISGPNVLGPGNEAAQRLVNGDYDNWVFIFPWTKMGATLFTYWSGIAGGIFAPSLSMGAALGANMGHWLNAPISACAMIGMAAFLSGAIQAPMTAFVIIFEMTGHHQMLLPIMLAALIAYLLARLMGTRNLYHSLADSYRYLLETPPTVAAPATKTPPTPPAN